MIKKLMLAYPGLGLAAQVLFLLGIEQGVLFSLNTSLMLISKVVLPWLTQYLIWNF